MTRISRAQAEPASHVAPAKALLAGADGATYGEAARMVGRRSNDAVSQLVSRFNRESLAAIEPRHGGGTATVYGATERERILDEFKRKPDREQDGTATWSLNTLQRALRQAPDGLPNVSIDADMIVVGQELILPLETLNVAQAPPPTPTRLPPPLSQHPCSPPQRPVPHPRPLQLEGTEYAVTPEQAAILLPLWQALQGGVTVQTEVAAVLKQIEGTMKQEQLSTIAAIQLTQEDMQAWMQEQGLDNRGAFPGAGGDPNARVTRQAGGDGEGPPLGDDMPPEIATARAQFENMSEEERAALRATMQAGGSRPGGDLAGTGRFGILLNPLIELLTERATE